MFKLQSSLRKGLALVLLLGVLAPFVFPAVAAEAQTRRSRRTIKSATTAKASTSPTPIVVPRLPPAAATTVSLRPQQTPTPAPAPPAQQQTKPTPSETPAADAVEDDEDDVVRVTSNLVVVPVSVSDAAGEPVQGLKVGDFRLEEEGRVQELTQVGDAEQVPLDIAILFDASSSVTAKNFFTLQQEAAARFLRQVLKPADRAAVITIGERAALVQALAPAETATAQLLKIPAATKSTPTAFYDAVTFAAKYLNDNAPGNHRRVILAISDGDDNFSGSVREQTVAEYEAQKKAEEAGDMRQPAMRAAARKDLQSRHQRSVLAVQRGVQSADAVFYSINPGGPSVRLNEISTRAQNGMRQVAESTGGTAYVPDRAEDLERIFRQIAAELRAQYLLQYQSNADAPAGKFLKIKVLTPARTDLRIRARQGYYKKG